MLTCYRNWAQPNIWPNCESPASACGDQPLDLVPNCLKLTAIAQCRSCFATSGQSGIYIYSPWDCHTLPTEYSCFLQPVSLLTGMSRRKRWSKQPGLGHLSWSTSKPAVRVGDHCMTKYTYVIRRGDGNNYWGTWWASACMHTICSVLSPGMSALTNLSTHNPKPSGHHGIHVQWTLWTTTPVYSATVVLI